MLTGIFEHCYIHICKFVAYRRIYNFSCVTSCHVFTSILEKLILFSTTGICNRIRNCARNVISKLFRNMHIKFSFTYEYIPQMLFFRWFARYTTFNSLEEYYLFFIKKKFKELRKCRVSKEIRRIWIDDYCHTLTCHEHTRTLSRGRIIVMWHNRRWQRGHCTTTIRISWMARIMLWRLISLRDKLMFMPMMMMMMMVTVVVMMMMVMIIAIMTTITMTTLLLLRMSRMLMLIIVTILITILMKVLLLCTCHSFGTLFLFQVHSGWW